MPFYNSFFYKVVYLKHEINNLYIEIVKTDQIDIALLFWPGNFICSYTAGEEKTILKILEENIIDLYLSKFK